MKQFFVFILTAFGVAIFDLIDSAFGNNLGIDSICVLSAFTVILWCAKVLGNLGKYAYDIRQKNFSECLLLQILSSGATSIFILIFCNKLPYIYHLTDRQYMLFTKCLFWFALVFPLRQIANFCDNYVVLNCKNRTLIISNVIYYALMIVLDLLVVIMGGKCYHLIITTDISYIVFFIYLWFAEKFWKQLNKIDKKALKKSIIAYKDLLNEEPKKVKKKAKTIDDLYNIYNNLNDKVTINITDIANLTSAINNISEQVNENKTNIDNNLTTITQIQNDIATNEEIQNIFNE